LAPQLPESPGTLPECGQTSLGVRRPLEVVLGQNRESTRIVRSDSLFRFGKARAFC
jgi:hypothetical protein